MALSSADESFPAPGITRSITNFGMRQSFQYRAKEICEDHEDFTATTMCCLTSGDRSFDREDEGIAIRAHMDAGEMGDRRLRIGEIRCGMSGRYPENPSACSSARGHARWSVLEYDAGRGVVAEPVRREAIPVRRGLPMLHLFADH